MLLVVNMDNLTLPNGLQRLLMHIMEDNILQSWRLTAEQNIILSLRFTSCDMESGQSQDTHYKFQQSKSYRSKPPSGVRRDTARHNAWATSDQQNPSTKGDTVLSKARFQCRSAIGNDADVEFIDRIDGQMQLPSFVTNTNSSVNDSGYQNMPMNVSIPNQSNPDLPVRSTCSIPKDTEHFTVGDIPSTPCALALPSPQQHSYSAIQHSNVLTSTPTQTAPEESHTATQTTGPLTSTQQVETIPPSDVGLQTSLPHSDVKQLQTDKVSSEEVCTQYKNPCLYSQESMTVPTDTREVGVATDPFPSRHVPTFSIKMENKKTGPRTTKNTSQTDPASFSAITQTESVAISEHPQP